MVGNTQKKLHRSGNFEYKFSGKKREEAKYKANGYPERMHDGLGEVGLYGMAEHGDVP